jgi:hypothetical protein
MRSFLVGIAFLASLAFPMGMRGVAIGLGLLILNALADLSTRLVGDDYLDASAG